jgi:signal transduction histidine kinase
MNNDNLIHSVQDVHVKELIKRLHWAVVIRWYYIAISTLFILCFYWIMAGHQISLRFDYLIGANFFLLVCNVLYQYQLCCSFKKYPGTHDLRGYLLMQIATDYLALMIVVYALGSIETPILLMLIPNIILSTLFFTPRQSLIITTAGLIFVSMPLVLEFFQLIPVISLFEQSIKATILTDATIFCGYLIILAACVFFCWYLLSSITSKLIKNELELEQSYKDMIRLDEEKTRATLRSTHELKAPLAAIKSYTYSLEGGYAGEISETVRKIINRIGKRCDYLLNNVTDIIKLGNLKSYVVSDSQFTEIELVGFLTRLFEEHKTLAREKQITVQVHNYLSDKPMIVASEENLQLIFLNLLTNAINYSYANSIIEITLSEEQFQNRNCMCVQIRDHGIGIDQENLSRVFDEHYRTNEAVSFYEGGTGLGLSIVKVCCQILNADIDIQSEKGQGTAVTVHFNCQPAIRRDKV